MSATMLLTSGSICRAVGRSRFTALRFDLAEAPNARLGVSFMVSSPLGRRSLGPPHSLSYVIHQTTGLRAVTGMSAGPMPEARWFTPDGSSDPCSHLLERKLSISDSPQPGQFAHHSDDSRTCADGRALVVKLRILPTH